jgi:hypothetical protein
MPIGRNARLMLFIILLRSQTRLDSPLLLTLNVTLNEMEINIVELIKSPNLDFDIDQINKD